MRCAGWLRRAGAGGEVQSAPLADPTFLAGCRAVFASDEDLGDDATRLIRVLAFLVPIVVLTHGTAGADVLFGGGTHRIAAAPARAVDPTGAGDVFAATFLCALYRGAPPLVAARHAAVAAAVAVEGPGPSTLTRLAPPLEWMTD
jgi:sugar/nucleoside kinase (ribokinase family)